MGQALNNKIKATTARNYYSVWSDGELVAEINFANGCTDEDIESILHDRIAHRMAVEYRLRHIKDQPIVATNKENDRKTLLRFLPGKEDALAVGPQGLLNLDKWKACSMYKEINPIAATGKTVKEFCYSWTSGQMIVVFDDETFVAFGIGYVCSEDSEIMPKKLEWLEFGDDKLIGCGIVTEAELYNMRDDS